MKDLILAGLLHDVGKTQILLSILNKPGALAADEINVIKQHPSLGFELIKAERAVPHSVACGILQHHERMHGGGYPHGRIGVDIQVVIASQFALARPVVRTSDGEVY